jgi:hypothetical protein
MNGSAIQYVATDTEVKFLGKQSSLEAMSDTNKLYFEGENGKTGARYDLGNYQLQGSQRHIVCVEERSLDYSRARTQLLLRTRRPPY